MWRKYFPPVYNSYFSIEDLGCKTVFQQGYRQPCSVNPERNACRDNPFPKIICLDGSRQFQERETTHLHVTHRAATIPSFSCPQLPWKWLKPASPPGRPSQFLTGERLPLSMYANKHSPICGRSDFHLFMLPQKSNMLCHAPGVLIYKNVPRFL